MSGTPFEPGQQTFVRHAGAIQFQRLQHHRHVAVVDLRDQVQQYRAEPKLYDRLAKTYAAQGKIALQHMALAESYVLTGAVPAAVDQLNLARKAKDASFYDEAVIDARERELNERQKADKKEKKER